MAFFNKILNFFRRRVTLTARYYINNREVSEAEWYANGGLEVEEELAQVEKMLNEIKL